MPVQKPPLYVDEDRVITQIDLDGVSILVSAPRGVSAGRVRNAVEKAGADASKVVANPQRYATDATSVANDSEEETRTRLRGDGGVEDGGAR